MRRGWFVAAIVIGVLSIVVAALIARLQDEGGRPSAEEWAGSVCSSLVDWRTSITSLADVSGGTLTPESLGAKLDEARTATSTLVSELKALGPPDLEAGDQLKEKLDADAGELESSFDALRQAAEEARNAGPGEFLQKLAALAPTYQRLLDAIAATVDDLRNADVAAEARAELRQAFADAPSCQELRSNG